jgi:hypothetical protein
VLMGAHHSDGAAGHTARSCAISSEGRVMQIARRVVMSPQISGARLRRSHSGESPRCVYEAVRLTTEAPQRRMVIAM